MTGVCVELPVMLNPTGHQCTHAMGRSGEGKHSGLWFAQSIPASLNPAGPKKVGREPSERPHDKSEEKTHLSDERQNH